MQANGVILWWKYGAFYVQRRDILMNFQRATWRRLVTPSFAPFIEEHCKQFSMLEVWYYASKSVKSKRSHWPSIHFHSLPRKHCDAEHWLDCLMWKKWMQKTTKWDDFLVAIHRAFAPWWSRSCGQAAVPTLRHRLATTYTMQPYTAVAHAFMHKTLVNSAKAECR